MDASLAGKLLVASPVLLDPNFFRTVVLVMQHDPEGALGVVLNRASGEAVDHHLPEWRSVVGDPAVVFVGGPVEPVIGIGLSFGEGQGRSAALRGVGVVDLGSGPGELSGPVRVFAGYAGWGAGQLERELAEGAWIVVNAETVDVFTETPERLWSAVLHRQGGRLSMLSMMPADPRLN